MQVYKKLIKVLPIVIFMLLGVNCGGVGDSSTEGKCPVSCAADDVGWEVNFECEAEGQAVTRTFEDFTTEFVDGEPHVSGDVTFDYGTSGNSYLVSITIEPCSQSDSGYCITAKATGDMLGDEPVTCKNY